jgi:acyl carrier protein
MKDRLCVTVASVLGLSPDEVSDATSRENCHKWDSLQHFVLILAIEQEYGVRFLSERIPELTGVFAIREEIDRLKAGWS